MTETMRDLHRLRPCATCPTRMAVPGSPVCTVCDAHTIAASVPATVADMPAPRGATP